VPNSTMPTDPTAPPHPSPELLQRVDHLVYATPDVDATVAAIARLTGVRATDGGPHPGRGTRNALLALDTAPGAAAYLEIVGPDPGQPPPERARWFGIDALRAPRLAAWAATAPDLEWAAAGARAAGVPLGAVRDGSRRRPDGTLLTWRFTDPDAVAADGIVPFLIDWGESPHPSRGAARGLSLLGLRAEHPEPRGTRERLARLGLALPVDGGAAPALVATLHTPRGEVTLR